MDVGSYRLPKYSGTMGHFGKRGEWNNWKKWKKRLGLPRILSRAQTEVRSVARNERVLDVGWAETMGSWVLNHNMSEPMGPPRIQNPTHGDPLRSLDGKRFSEILYT
jgi:hypothetical protein